MNTLKRIPQNNYAENSAQNLAQSPAQNLTQHIDLLNQLLAERAPYYAQHLRASDTPKGFAFTDWATQQHYNTLIERFALAHPSVSKNTHADAHASTNANNSATISTKLSTIDVQQHSVQTSIAGSQIKAQENTRKDIRKAQHSLWAQWYFGLLVPPIFQWLVHQHSSLDFRPNAVYLQPHETGRVASFCLHISSSPHVSCTPQPQKSTLDLHQVLSDFILQGLQPTVLRLSQLSQLPAKAYWSHLGYLIYWYLGELTLTPSIERQLKEAIFKQKTLPLGGIATIKTADNPLYNSIKIVDNQCIRRTCCLRYQLANTGQCHDCPLLKSP